MPDTSFYITREELYRRLWEVPFNQIIEEYGTTYGVLRTVADELNVPRPPRGYWKKHVAGTAGELPSLPDLKPGQPRSRKLVSRDLVRREEADRRQSLEALLGEIRVPASLTRPHPLVAGWMAERRAHHRFEMKQSTLASSFYAPSDIDRRRHLILQALLPALERQGAQITGGADEQKIEARFAEATIAFRLREKLKQVRQPLTDKERSQPWMAASSYHLELHPSGNLSFRIETHTALGCPTWEDSDRNKLEDHLMDIAVALLRARDSVIKAKRYDQERLEQQQDREKQKRLAAEAVQREEARWTAFVDLSRRSDEAAHLRRFLARLEAAELPPESRYGDRTIADWLTWMRTRIDQADPLTAGAIGAFEQLARLGI